MTRNTKNWLKAIFITSTSFFVAGVILWFAFKLLLLTISVLPRMSLSECLIVVCVGAMFIKGVKLTKEHFDEKY